ncbi:MAG: translation elongation factor Ts [Patescibacteria group bacterium]
METAVKNIQELRQKTGAGVMDCKEALNASTDLEQAIVYLRKKGLADINERNNKESKEGIVAHYIHTGGRVGVLVEVSSETDFVAKSDAFKEFAHDVALQIAASNPQYISRDQVPQNIIDREKEIISSSIQGKPPQIIEKIVAGKLNKVFKEICLMEQPFVKNPDITVTDLLGAAGAKLGEKIVIKKFCRFVVGE